jgi:hypothetical protein
MHHWLNVTTTRSERYALQAAGPWNPAAPQIDDIALGHETLTAWEVLQIPRGQMLRQAYWPPEAMSYRDQSLEAWKHPLDALTNAWCRLLTLVGLR